jgi:putative ABC transport system permease protein
MGSLFGQIRAVIGMTISGLPSRFWASATTVVSVALVVGTLLAFLAMGNGFRKTVEGTGSDDIAMILGTGSSGSELNSTMPSAAVRILEEAPGIARDEAGKPIVSPETFVAVGATRRAGGGEVNVTFRGVTAFAPGMRPGFRIAEGRMYEPGTNELVVGAGVAREFSGFDVGNEIRLGANRWQVVIQTVFDRGPTVAAVRARLERTGDLQPIKDFVASEPRIRVDVKTEKEHFAAGAGNIQSLINIGVVLAVTLALGALAGALNTMYAAVEARTKEMATLRAIGFGGFPAFVGAMTESIVLSLAGGAVGVLGAYLVFNGASASTLGDGFTQVVFDFSVGPAQMITGVVIALILGLVGGFFPALKAARTPLLRLGAE